MSTTTVTPLTPTPATGEPIDFWSAQSLAPMEAKWPKLLCRFINAKPIGAWNDFILSEWELRACAWEDFHPHSETNFVVEGELYVQSQGKTVILRPGDSARVNPGGVGRYWAPVYARMVTIYGPNPEGRDSHSFRYEEL